MTGFFLLAAIWTPCSSGCRSRGDRQGKRGLLERSHPRRHCQQRRLRELSRQRRTRAHHPIDPAVTVDLLAAALAGGASIPSAIQALHEAVDDGVGEGLSLVSSQLSLGASWEEAWDGAPAEFRHLEEVLAPAWEDGSAPIPLLNRRGETIRRERSQRAKEIAATLGEKLIFPLVTCFLPAFILLGIVPIIVSVGMELL